jgi:hypothetical protein
VLSMLAHSKRLESYRVMAIRRTWRDIINLPRKSRAGFSFRIEALRLIGVFLRKASLPVPVGNAIQYIILSAI